MPSKDSRVDGGMALRTAIEGARLRDWDRLSESTIRCGALTLLRAARLLKLFGSFEARPHFADQFKAPGRTRVEPTGLAGPIVLVLLCALTR